MMSTTRLKEIYKQEQNHRKFLYVMNDLAKTQQDLYEGYLDREKQEAVQKCQKSILMTKRNVVRQRVLKKCMKSTREEVEKQHGSDKYGRYNGVCVEQIAENIDSLLEQEHPRVRRQRNINHLFQKGYEKGAILDYSTTKRKVDEYFERPLVRIHPHKQGAETKPRDKPTFLPPLASGFYTGDVLPHDWAKEGTIFNEFRTDLDATDSFVERKVSKFLEEDVPDDMSVQSEVQVMTKYKSAHRCRPNTLPPIKVGTDNSTAHGKPRTDCITDLITRLNNAKDRREKESKLRKEKRAKRLQAERVHGYTQATNGAGIEEVKGHHLLIEGHGPKNLTNDSNDTSPADTFDRLPPLKFKTPGLQKINL